MAALLKAAGARLLSRPPSGLSGGDGAAGAAQGPTSTLVLCEPAAGGSGGSPAEQQRSGGGGAAAVPPAGAEGLRAEKWYARAAEAGVPVVAHSWLIDSVAAYTPRPLAGYTF